MPRKEVPAKDLSQAAEVVDAQALTTLDANAAALSDVRQQADARVRAVAVQLGYQLPADCTDPDLIQRDISANMRRSVEACLQVGMGLCVLKAGCQHGEFTARLDVLGIETTVAQRFMHSATKFSNAATSRLLGVAGNQSKLFEMLVLDDEQIEELELTGQTGELKLDEIATMSVKELRAALREERKERQADADVLKRKAEQIEKLERENQRIAKMKPDEALLAVKKEAASFYNDAQGLIVGQLRQALKALHDNGAEVVYMAGLVGQLKADMDRLRQEFDLPDLGDVADQQLASEVAQWAGN
jgi:hypothetical protein